MAGTEGLKASSSAYEGACQPGTGLKAEWSSFEAALPHGMPASQVVSQITAPELLPKTRRISDITEYPSEGNGGGVGWGRRGGEVILLK